MKKLRFAIFGNTYQAKKSACVQRLISILEERGASLLIDRLFYEYLTNKLGIVVSPEALIEGNDFHADFVISMGGDGTFLEAARRVGDKGMPILGINMGRLGFLSDYQAEDIASAIDHIYNGTYRIEERTVLMVEKDGNDIQGYPYALNEVAVLKHDISSMISIDVEINGEFLTTYQADGLIVNTSTGSTGYALSVGGPIIVPGTKIIGLVPVAPHSLTVRPLTLSADAIVRMKVKSRSHNFLLSVDGRSESATEDTTITIRKAPYTISVLKRSKGSFFSTLRDKLMWGADSRE
ncbi:MAG: NAD kinase [Bacteroidaceae bacterium]|nr:NAD kinase [Bacteroidaceae bacterium]